MLMEQYLREDFHFTPYSTICYLIKASNLANRSSFELDVAKKNAIETNDSNGTNIIKIKKTTTKAASAIKKHKIVDIASDDSDDIIHLDDNEEPKNKKVKS